MNSLQARAEYKRMLAKIGKDVVIRRYTGNTAGTRAIAFTATARARVTEYDASELVGPITQGDSKCIVLAEDLEAASFPLPIIVGDKCVVDGRELAITAPNPQTRQLAGTVIAYDLNVRG